MGTTHTSGFGRSAAVSRSESYVQYAGREASWCRVRAHDRVILYTPAGLVQSCLVRHPRADERDYSLRDRGAPAWRPPQSPSALGADEQCFSVLSRASSRPPLDSGVTGQFARRSRNTTLTSEPQLHKFDSAELDFATCPHIKYGF